MSASLMIVEDDRQQRRYLAAVLSSAGHKVDAFQSAEEAHRHLRDGSTPPPDVILLDINLPGADGITFLNRLRGEGHSQPVIILTADGSLQRAVEAMRAGATDFLVKPVGPERLEISIRNTIALSTLTNDVRRLSRVSDGTLGFEDLVAESSAIRETIELARRAAHSDIPVLISGESGSGKEVFARAIHGASNRRGKPFVAVNCGALPEHLVESILFGHERGAFTGAVEKRIGKFQEAEGGTLFLDEIGELPAEAQVKLLRVLQSHEVDPLGANGAVPVNIRIISATNRDLGDLVQSGGFRTDLYYRLTAFPLMLPPLRERREDLAHLAQMFLTRYAAAEGVRLSGFSDPAMRMIESADWPGNVRQMQNTIHRAVVMADGKEVCPEHLIGLSVGGAAAGDDHGMARPRVAACEGRGEYVNGAVRDLAPVRPIRDPLLTDDGQIRKLADIEAEAIERALSIYHGRMAEVARRLGIGRSTLYRKLDELNLTRRRA
ncbi:MAG: sigma-54 dependent transcriptional regulator [Pseudomonadota bacterium]